MTQRHGYSWGKITVLAAVVSVAGVAATAYPPARSLFPQPRPGSVASVTAPVVQQPRIRSQVVETPADEAVAQAILSEQMRVSGAASTAVARSLMPRARPAGVRTLPRRTSPSAPRAVAAAPEPSERRGILSRIFGRDRGAGSRSVPSEPTGIENGLCGSRDLQGRRLPPITSSRSGCGIAEPVALTAVHGIPLTMEARLDCRVALAFAQWVDQAMVPAVGRRGGGIARIRIIGDYSCRTRNSRPGARLSEHARGMAIDVAGYTLNDGTTVSLLQDWRRRPHRSDLREMHENACGIFRTTLGPESDRHHQDHFHYDLADHRGGGNYCR